MRLREKQIHVYVPDTNMSMSIDKARLMEIVRTSTCAREVLKHLCREPLTVRELAIRTEYSARHIHRVVKKLEEIGAVKRLASLVFEVSSTTDSRLIPTYEKIWKFVVVDKSICETLD